MSRLSNSQQRAWLRWRLPVVLYETSPYFYCLFALFTLYVSGHLLIQLLAGVIYAAGAIIFGLRADFRRATPKQWNRDARLVNLPEDLYELLPFIALLAGVLLTKHATSSLQLLAGVLLGGYGLFILAVRISLRKISWLHAWQATRTATASEVSPVVLRPQPRAGRLVDCERCKQARACRRSGLTDKSNYMLVKWLHGRQSQTGFTALQQLINRLEPQPLEREALLEALERIRPQQEHCLSWQLAHRSPLHRPEQSDAA